MSQTVDLPSPSTQPTPGASALLQADEFVAPAWIAWWYRLAALHPPVGRVATLHERERIRRSRLASILLAVQLVLIEGPVISVVANAPTAHALLPATCRASRADFLPAQRCARGVDRPWRDLATSDGDTRCFEYPPARLSGLPR